MKRLLIIGFGLLIVTTSSMAQTKETKAVNKGYYELNFGAALIEGDVEMPFPGISFLIGNKTYFPNNFIIDVEIGLALPSIATGKFGIGFKTGPTELIVGIRPWPTHFYLQTQLNSREKGGWIMSFELSPYTFSRSYNDAVFMASFQSKGMINFGYRWNLK